MTNCQLEIQGPYEITCQYVSDDSPLQVKQIFLIIMQ